MSDKKTLDYETVRKIVHSISELVVFDGTLKEKQHRALKEICEIMSIPCYVKCFAIVNEDCSLKILDAVTNLEGHLLENYIQSTSKKGDHDPTYNKVWELMMQAPDPINTLFSFRNDELFSKEEQENHPYFIEYHKKPGIGSLIYSVKPLENNQVATITFMRPVGMPDFSPEEKNLLHIILNDIPFLYMDKIPERLDQLIELTPRLNETLKFLIEGYSAKDIARLMNLTEHTIRTYTKNIYKQFLVSSRSELMVLFKS